MPNIYSGKPCGCGDFDFCVVCADPIEARVIKEMEEIEANLPPRKVELMSQDTSFTPEQIDAINAAGEKADELDALAYAANSEVLGYLEKFQQEWGVLGAPPYHTSEYELLFGDWFEYRRNHD